MSIEENKKLIQRYFDEVLNKGNHEAMDELMDDNFNGKPAGVGTISGKEAHVRLFTGYRLSVPDLNIELNETIAEGDKVVAVGTWHGTFTGAAIFGQPANGKKFAFTNVAIYRIRNGKMINGRVIGDSLNFFKQLGLTPPPEMYK